MKGTANMVIPWAKTINSSGSLPNISAMDAPIIIISVIKIFTGVPFKFLPKDKASESNVPPILAFPKREEKEAPNKPIINTINENFP